MPAFRPANDVVDRDRLQRTAAGDIGALQEFYDTHVARVWGFARRLLDDDHEAEEVTQDVFVRVWHRAGEYDPQRASPWGWVAMMTRSICLDRLRARSRRPDLGSAVALDELEPTAGDDATSEDVGSLLEAVRPVERSCLTHVFLDGLTLVETADRTGLPLGSVKTHVRRALQRLRDMLSPHDS